MGGVGVFLSGWERERDSLLMGMGGLEEWVDGWTTGMGGLIVGGLGTETVK
jgi:hypothetical protein